MKNTPIDSKLAGQRNERLVLSLLREHGELSQTQVCRMIGLGSSTASSIVSRLRDKELIIENQGKSDKRGPKPVLLKINPSARYVIGLEISPSFIHVGLFDFVAGLLKKQKFPLPENHSPERVLEAIDGSLLEISRGVESFSDKLLGIGVTLGGSISQQGSVRLSSTMGWKQVPLKELMELRLKQKVAVYSTRVRLMAEIAQEPEMQSRNILYLNVSNGVGATVYMDGKLMAGSTGMFGEIGHIITDPQGPVCGCGHRGCLEALISGRALSERIHKDIAAGVSTLIAEGLRDLSIRLPEEVVALWGGAIAAGDRYALEIRDFVASHLNRAAAAAMNSFDPDTLILAGYVCCQSEQFFAESIRSAMSDWVYDAARRDIRIMFALGGENALINGAAMSILQDVHPI